MNEMFKNKFLLFCLAITAAVALNGLMAYTTLAEPPVVGSSGRADVPNPPIGEAGLLDQDIVISWDDGDDPSTSIEDGSFVTVSAPSGLKFTNVADATLTEAAVTIVDGTDLEDHLSSDGTTIRFNIDSPGAAGSITISDLELCPDDDTIMDMGLDGELGKEGINLQLSIVANGGFSTVETTSVGQINLLNRPDIVTVDEVSDTELEVTLKSEIVEPTVDAFLISEDGDAAGVNPTAVELDDNDNRKVKLTHDLDLDFEKKPTVQITDSLTDTDDALLHKEDRDGVDGLTANGSKKPRTVRLFATVGDPDPVVTVNNEVVGVNSAAVDESVNEARVNIVSTSGQPLKIKIVCADDDKLNAPVDLANVTAKVSGQTDLLEGEDDAPNDSDELNDDVLCIPGEFNDGDIDVLLGFGENGADSFSEFGDDDGLLPLVGSATPIEKGDEKALVVLVSPDDFSVKIGSGTFTVDRKEPKVIKSGDDKPVVGDDRKSIKLTFNEALDPNSTEDIDDWLVTGDATGDFTTDSVDLDSATKTMVTIKTEELFQDEEILSVKVMSGSTTAVPNDQFFNPIVCEDDPGATDHEVLVDDVEAADLNAPTKTGLDWEPTEAGNAGVSDVANKVDITIETQEAVVNADLFQFQVFVQDTSDSLGIDFDRSIGDPFNGSVLSEVSSRRFEGEVELNDSDLVDGDNIVLLCGISDEEPASRSDWEDLDPQITDPLSVDNTQPFVDSAFRVDNTNNQFNTRFNEEMQLASLRDRLPEIICGSDELTVSGVNIVGGSDNAIYTIFGEFPAEGDCVVKFEPDADDNMVQDLNGNQMDDDDEIGVDEANILGEAPPETTTTTLPTGTETTTTTLVPGTSTTTTLAPGETTTTTTGTGVTTTTLGDGNEISVDPSTSRRTLRTQIATVSVTDANGDPVAGVDVTATPEGRRVQVSPSSATTGANGTAEFNYRFGFLSQGGVITFEADGLSTTLSQQ